MRTIHVWCAFCHTTIKGNLLISQGCCLSATQDTDVIRQADAYVVTYSMTDRSSYQWAYSFIDEITQTQARRDLSNRHSSTNVTAILVANKSDLVRKRQVSTEGDSY